MRYLQHLSDVDEEKGSGAFGKGKSINLKCRKTE
jgi:hypothetical protein